MACTTLSASSEVRIRRIAASLVTAVYQEVSLIPRYLRALPAAFYKAVLKFMFERLFYESSNILSGETKHKERDSKWEV